MPLFIELLRWCIDIVHEVPICTALLKAVSGHLSGRRASAAMQSALIFYTFSCTVKSK